MAMQDTERIVGLVDAAGGHCGGQYRADVLALRSEIGLALAEGYPCKTVWKALRQADKIEMSYDRFRVLCRELGLRARRSRASAGEDKNSDIPARALQSAPAPTAPVARPSSSVRRQPVRPASGFLHPKDVPIEAIY